MVKKSILILCIVILLTLVACKQDATENSYTNNDSDLSKVVDSNQENLTSGIELEEDLFDDSDDAKTPTQSNQSNVTSSKEESTTENTTSDKTDKTESNASDSTKTDETEDSTSSNESSADTSSKEATVEDGVVKLPIDKFD